MKRYDIGDSYLLWLLERVLATRLNAPQSYVRIPTIGNARSLSFPFHSPAAMEAGWGGVDRPPPIRNKSTSNSGSRESGESRAPPMSIRLGGAASPITSAARITTYCVFWSASNAYKEARTAKRKHVSLMMFLVHRYLLEGARSLPCI